MVLSAFLKGTPKTPLVLPENPGRSKDPYGLAGSACALDHPDIDGRGITQLSGLKLLLRWVIWGFQGYP